MDVIKTSKKIDETGKRYGYLLVVGPTRKNGRLYWACRCDCGNKTVVYGSALRNGDTKSCGCYHNRLLSERTRKYKNVPRRVYSIWHDMLSRCENENNRSFLNYGGRGIRVCDEWHDVEAFYDWAIKNGYENNLTIERINNNGNYEPINCKWATKKEQENNRRNNRKVTINNETKNLQEWCEIYGINPVSVHSRIRYGWDIERAITTPVKVQRGQYAD